MLTMLSDDSAPHSSESLGLLATTESSKSEGKQPEPVHHHVARNTSGYLWSLVCTRWPSRRLSLMQRSTGFHDSFTDEVMWSDTSNMTVLDQLWYDMDVKPGIIQLPKDARLGSTQTFPWDQSRGLRVCTNTNQKNIYAYVRIRQRCDLGGPTAGHIFHCLADIRLSVLCEADDTVLPFPGKQKVEVPAPKTFHPGMIFLIPAHIRKGAQPGLSLPMGARRLARFLEHLSETFLIMSPSDNRRELWDSNALRHPIAYLVSNNRRARLREADQELITEVEVIDDINAEQSLRRRTVIDQTTKIMADEGAYVHQSGAALDSCQDALVDR
ncbi:hypothetical protein CHU98_g12238 [Xylaria longipes]|nr:hypothetical protein CHU98_g12238 [Xylaria longipes]